MAQYPTSSARPASPQGRAVARAHYGAPSPGNLTSITVHARDLAPGDVFIERVGRLPNGLPIWRAVEIVHVDNLQKVMQVKRCDTGEVLRFPLADKSITGGKKLAAVRANPALAKQQGPHWTWVGEANRV